MRLNAASTQKIRGRIFALPRENRITSHAGRPGIRIDSSVYQGYVIPPDHDSMIAKLIAFAPTRDEAIKKMRWALAEFLIDGVDTNIDYQLSILKDADFVNSNYDVGFLLRKNFAQMC